MKGKIRVSAEELKHIELDIILEIDKFCKKNGIRYFLSSGTLLGAIRHKGFIPWDDDADLMMPRPDYDRFIKSFKSEKYILNYPCKPGYYQSIVKVSDKRTVLIQRNPLADEPLGVHIDVLPLDGESDSKEVFIADETRLLRLFGYSCWLRRRKFWKIKDYTLKDILRHLYNIWKYRDIHYSLEEIYDVVEQESHKYQYEKSAYVGYITMSNYKYKQRHRRELFEKTIEVEFEGHKLPAPAGWDEYLSNLFRDYMKLPPAEKRISQHVWTAYWK